MDHPASGIRVSICIPTRNRAGFIGDTLDSIIGQASEAIEIVVVDGGSADNTDIVVQSRAHTFPRLRYAKSVHGNEDTQDRATHWSDGFEHDCDQAVAMAEGEYCWFFPDDDVLKPGAIGRVVDATQHHHSLIVVNAEVRTRDLAVVLESQRLRIDLDRLYAPWEQDRMLTDIAGYLSYIGGVVLRRELWISRRGNSQRATGFPHVAVIFQDALPGSTLVIAHPWIEIRYGNAQWSPRAFEIWMVLWPRLIWSFGHIADLSKAAVVTREPWKAPKRLARLRATGAYSLQEYETWILPSESTSCARSIARIVAMTPGKLANLLVLTYSLLFRRGLRLELADLRASPHFILRHGLLGVQGEASSLPAVEVDR